MGIWDAITGNAIADPIKEAGNAIDKVFTSDDERLAWLNKYYEIQKEIALKNQDVNIASMQPNSKFIWRDAVGWICVVALGWSYVIHPVMIFTLNVFGVQTMHVEDDIGSLMPILISMLGIGINDVIKGVK